MSKLTAREQRILKHPPTRQTWVCTTKRTAADATKVECGGLLPGYATRCHYCGGKKPRKPKMLWPFYEQTCKKAGIDPDNPKGVAADADQGASA